MTATIKVIDLIRILCNEWKPNAEIAVLDLEIIINDNGGENETF